MLSVGNLTKIATVVPRTLVINSCLSLFCPFIETKNKNQTFRIKLTLYFKGILNSIDFHKRIFLHVIPAPIIIPCTQLANIYYLHEIKIPHFCSFAFSKTAFSFYIIRHFMIRKS